MDRYILSIDEKGRTALPDALREALGDTAVITLGKDQTLQLYSAAQWSAGPGRLPAEALHRLRPLLAHAAQLDLAAPQVTLPAQLLAYAQLTSRAALTCEDGRWYVAAL